MLQRSVVESCERLEFHDVHPPLARLTLRDKRLWLREVLCDLDLRQPGVLASCTKTLEEGAVAWGSSGAGHDVVRRSLRAGDRTTLESAFRISQKGILFRDGP